MASSYPGQVTAVQVGSYFVGQYYQILQQRPDFAHQFYSDASAMIRVDGDSTETVSGMMQIHSLLTTLNFTGIEIKTAQSLDSWNGAVLVVVSGFVQTKNYSARRKFMQTILLAPQEKGYFILNDVFHFLEEEQVQDYTSSLLAHSNFDHNNYESKLSTPNLSPKQVTNYVLGGEAESSDLVDSDLADTVQAEESETVDLAKYSFSEAQPPVPEHEDVIEEIPSEEPVDSFSNVVEIVRDLPPVLPEEPVREPQKQTYASVLRIAKGQPAHATSYPASLNKAPPVMTEWQNVPQSVPQPVLSAGNEKFNFDAMEEAFIPEDEGDAKSVYVGNLPACISVADLEQEFKNFGRIKPDGVTIRNRKEAGVYYAFVEFEDVLGVQNALKASPIEINGRQIHVEARRPNSGAIRGRRGRGRGGYLSEAPRGRFGGRTFARGDYNNRSRGNGYPQRGGAFQERGILGSQYESNY